jgi:PKD domain
MSILTLVSATYTLTALKATFVKGSLYFYNNTLISNRTDRTTLFRSSTNDETVDARNNIFYSTAAGSTVSLADVSGVFELNRNWIKPGWVTSFGTFSGTVNNNGTVTGSAPGFVDEAGQDYRLTSTSQCVNTPGNPNLNPAVLPANDVIRQYVKHQSTEPRPSDGIYDIGAHEFSNGGGNQQPVPMIVASPESGIVPLAVSFSGSASYDPDGSISAYSWEFGDGGTATGFSVLHTYNAAGTFTALLRVTDNAGATASTTQTITVNPLPAPVLSGSVSGRSVSLSWTDSSGGSASGWIVERKGKNGGGRRWRPST